MLKSEDFLMFDQLKEKVEGLQKKIQPKNQSYFHKLIPLTDTLQSSLNVFENRYIKEAEIEVGVFDTELHNFSQFVKAHPNSEYLYNSIVTIFQSADAIAAQIGHLHRDADAAFREQRIELKKLNGSVKKSDGSNMAIKYYDGC